MNKKATVLAVMSLIVLSGCGQTEPANDSTTVKPASTSTESNVDTSATKPTGGSNNVYEGTISGVISDSMCGKDHSGMGELGKDPVACTHKCVEQGAKYVLVADNGDVYRLSDPGKAKELAGKTVSIEGHIDPKEKAIHVHSMASK